LTTPVLEGHNEPARLAALTRQSRLAEAGRARGQIGGEPVQIRRRPSGKRRPDPLVELLIGQPLLGERHLQTLSGRIAFGVRGEDRRFRAGPGPDCRTGRILLRHDQPA